MRTLTAERVTYARLSVNELFAMLPNFGGMVFLFAEFKPPGNYLKLVFLLAEGYGLYVWLPTKHSGQPAISLVRNRMVVQDIFCPDLNGVAYCLHRVIAVSVGWRQELLLKTMQECWFTMQRRRAW